MRLLRFVLITVLFVPPAAAASVLTRDGIGAIHIGMHWHDAERAIGHKIPLNDLASDDAEVCSNADIPTMPGVSILLEHYRIRVISIGRGYATHEGVRVGMSEAALRRKFGKRARFESRPYFGDEPGAHNIVVRLGGRREFLFQSQKGRVQIVNVGERPAVEYWEGCV